MADIDFFIDEAALVAALSLVQSDLGNLRNLVQVIDAVLELECDAVSLNSFSDIYSLNVAEELSVAQIVFEGIQDGKLRDLLLRLQIALSHANACDDDNGVGYARTAITKIGRGILISDSDLSGEPWWLSELMLLISSANQIPSALRTSFVQFGLPLASLETLARYMFSKIHFHATPVDFKKTGLDFDEYRKLLITHLSYLNDKAVYDFRSAMQPKDIIGNARSEGVEMSAESPNTHRNKNAMKERDIEIAGKSISCEWHTKLDGQRGRIHFYAWIHSDPAVKSVVGEKVIVGIIAEHLTT